ncbi:MULTISPECIES: sterol desaturase family protein [Amycolatopsis]|uniref:Sterol desaturase family protein n=1 Tax=Amycolatopsis albidoflavus TaxID=102226 RepID=A0ABW5I859_9PSEU
MPSSPPPPLNPGHEAVAAAMTYTQHYPRRVEAVRRALPYLFLGVYPTLGVIATLHGSWFGILAIYGVVEISAILAERFLPFVRPAAHNRWRNRVTDIIYLVTSPLLLLALQQTVVPWMGNLRHSLLGDTAYWATGLPTAVQVALVLIGMEFTYYWAHRLSHSNNIFWRSHRIHHSPDNVDWLMGWRIHWLNEALHLVARFVPVILLGVPTPVVALALVIVNVHSMFPHINADVHSARLLTKVVNTPEMHRWHHVVDPAAAGNYASTFMLWDQVFGTYRSPILPPTTEFGIEPEELKNVPPSWSQQILSPLRKNAADRYSKAGRP